MKKVILSVFAIVAMVSAANAQELAIGIKAGPNFASLSGGNASEVYKNRTGYHVGAFVLFKFSKIGIQPELLFSKQGSNYTIPNSSQSFKNDFTYFNVPIMLKLYTVAGINLQVGPQFGFVTAAKSTYSVNGATATQDIKNDLKSSDISASMGLGWDLPFGLSLAARYNLGLTKISSDNDAPKNQVFQVSVGYRFFKIGS